MMRASDIVSSSLPYAPTTELLAKKLAIQSFFFHSAIHFNSILLLLLLLLQCKTSGHPDPKQGSWAARVVAIRDRD